MVATIGGLTSSAQAASFYEADDYYAEGSEPPSSWEGKGADDLGLDGDVDRDTFRALLDGKIAGRQLRTMRGGQLEHRPGWDLTLSAPKSVSVMALVAGDKRLIAAHAAAVILAGRQSRMSQPVRLSAEEGRFQMTDLLLNYRACGAECRDDYLRGVANENGLPLECVRKIAGRLGEREDFGALILICEDRRGRVQ